MLKEPIEDVFSTKALTVTSESVMKGLKASTNGRTSTASNDDPTKSKSSVADILKSWRPVIHVIATARLSAKQVPSSTLGYRTSPSGGRRLRVRVGSGVRVGAGRAAAGVGVGVGGIASEDGSGKGVVSAISGAAPGAGLPGAGPGGSEVFDDVARFAGPAVNCRGAALRRLDSVQLKSREYFSLSELNTYAEPSVGW